MPLTRYFAWQWTCVGKTMTLRFVEEKPQAGGSGVLIWVLFAVILREVIFSPTTYYNRVEIHVLTTIF